MSYFLHSFGKESFFLLVSLHTVNPYSTELYKGKRNLSRYNDCFSIDEKYETTTPTSHFAKRQNFLQRMAFEEH